MSLPRQVGVEHILDIPCVDPIEDNRVLISFPGKISRCLNFVETSVNVQIFDESIQTFTHDFSCDQ